MTPRVSELVMENFYQKIDYQYEWLSYDKNGNITSLTRTGDYDGELYAQAIDILAYTYDDHSNILQKVTDSTNSPLGFKDDSDGTNDTEDDYEYDDNGNMISDQNKGIERIKYNHLNLPTQIDFVNKKHIYYFYNAVGVKLKKMIVNGLLDITTTDYLGGFQYVNTVLQFFPHPEGYVKNTPDRHGSPTYDYVYNYTDHLGNIRLSYTLDPATHALKILEENHYYPFGLKHTNYSSDKKSFVLEQITEDKKVLPVLKNTYDYKYNGKEWQDELGLNFYDYHARNYDPALGRWMNIDPLAENSRRWTPYNYAYNNSIYFIDPDGMQAGAAKGLNFNWKADGKSETDFSSNYHTSTVVNNRGEIIDYKDDGDDNIYLNKRGGIVVGKERKGVKYTPGLTVAPADLLEDFNYTNGLITDISRINAEKKAGKNPNAKIHNCPLCSSRRCNGASHTSVTRAAKAGYNGMTTAGGLGYGAAAWWVEGATAMGGVIGLFGAFVPGYIDDAHAQYTEYNTQLQEAQKEKDEN